MKKSEIFWRDNLPYPEIQKFFIKEAEQNRRYYLLRYKQIPSSHNGRYINADLMKETFDLYSANSGSREKYNLILHNSAAVLANELFMQMLQTHDFRKCIFVAGIPGAGKSFFIQSLFLTNMITIDTIVMEVNIASSSFFEKLRQAEKYGAESSIIIVNAPIELAMRNVLKRKKEIGRDVGIQTMAKIYTEIPDYVSQIHEKYPNTGLAIFNKHNNCDADCLFGIKHLSILQHGSYEDVFNELRRIRNKLENEMFKETEGEQL